MAQHVRAVIERPADFAALGGKAERRVRSQYRFADYARRILAICAELRPDRDGTSGRVAQPKQPETLATI